MRAEAEKRLQQALATDRELKEELEELKATRT